jgi:hypothetical protein
MRNAPGNLNNICKSLSTVVDFLVLVILLQLCKMVI